jgi:hypothetical protein
MAEKNALALTGQTGLANLSSPPVEVVALLAYPIARLMGNGAAITRVENRRLL